MSDPIRVFDCLHGDAILSESLSNLVRAPIVQRLRDVRLSNIDSLSMPGVANISRYEHSIGVALLATRLSAKWGLTTRDACMFQAAALLHDSAIPPCGHLVEEALSYLGMDFDHESQWERLLQKPGEAIGGFDLQVYHGRQPGLRAWAEKEFADRADEAVAEILGAIRGFGRFGPAIAGRFDIDNLDNVVRAAYHIGLPTDKALPGRICDGIVGTRDSMLVISEETVDLLKAWLELRTQLYQHFMLSRVDFIGKAMIIYATIDALRSGHLDRNDWILTDRAYLQRLLDLKDSDAQRTVERWVCYELWSMSDLLWFEGPVPGYEQVYSFGESLSKNLGRPCFAYTIRDKRFRQISALTVTGHTATIGTDSKRWLLGVVSPRRKEFTRDENIRIADMAARIFGSNCLGSPNSETAEASQETRLLLELV